MSLMHQKQGAERERYRTFPLRIQRDLRAAYESEAAQVATYCDTLQRTATHCNNLQHTNTLHHAAYESEAAQVATYCDTLQRTTTHYNALQQPATHQHISSRCLRVRSGTGCNILRHTRTHYNTLQHTATHCITPTHWITQPTSPKRHRLQCTADSLQRTQQTHCSTLHALQPADPKRCRLR